MNFHSRFTSCSTEFIQQSERAFSELYSRLNKLPLKELEISDYNKKYLGEHITEFEKISWFLSHVFMLVGETSTDLSKITIIDYGGGSGMLSYVAKLLGVGTVIYNDIYDVSCKDVEVISEKLGLKIDHIIEGDIDKVIEYTNTNNLKIDYVIALDVIEHIYDVPYWYSRVKDLPSSKLNVISTSHANPYNPLINSKLSKLQINVEKNEREKQWGHKERDSLNSFFEIRKNIISKELPQIDDKELVWLTKQTRGLMIQDVLKELSNYKDLGTINYTPKHKTNTCDPLTGNWIEQLIDLKQLDKDLIAMDYHSDIIRGFYINTKGGFFIAKGKIIANYMIKHLGFKGFYLAPYYIVSSTYK